MYILKIILSCTQYLLAYTLTNTGFGALNESNFRNETIVFTVCLMLAGFASLIFAVGIVIDVIANGNFKGIVKGKKNAL